MTEKIRKECYQRVQALLKIELNSANHIEAINSLEIPVATFFFNWDSLLARLNSHYKAIELQEKEAQKD